MSTVSTARLLPCYVDHRWRQIDANNLVSSLCELQRKEPRSTTKIEDSPLFRSAKSRCRRYHSAVHRLERFDPCPPPLSAQRHTDTLAFCLPRRATGWRPWNEFAGLFRLGADKNRFRSGRPIRDRVVLRVFHFVNRRSPSIVTKIATKLLA